MILPATTRILSVLPLCHDYKCLVFIQTLRPCHGVGTIVIGQLPRAFDGLFVLFRQPTSAALEEKYNEK